MEKVNIVLGIIASAAAIIGALYSRDTNHKVKNLNSAQGADNSLNSVGSKNKINQKNTVTK